MRTETLNDNTQASDPGRIRLSHGKLRRFHPELYEPRGIWKWLKQLSPLQKFLILRKTEHMLHGDSRAALVVSVSPVLVAAYTDELDCIAMLRFADKDVADQDLQPGTRLLAVNLYGAGSNPVQDLENGPASHRRYSNFDPLIAEFVSDDIARIEYRKSEIAETEWLRTAELAAAFAAKFGQNYRDGCPLKSGIPATRR